MPSSALNVEYFYNLLCREVVLHGTKLSSVCFRVIAISSCLRSYPYSIALRYLQRKAIMLDPNWQKGNYYNTGKFPRTGTKLAR